MHFGRYIIFLLSRILISVVFILFALSSLFKWDEALQDLNKALNDWELFVPSAHFLHVAIQSMLEYAPIVLGVSTALQLLGGFLILFGIALRLGAFLLLVHLIPVTILFHPFWYLQGIDQSRELVLFMKNCLAIGGVLALSVVRSNLPTKRYKVVREGDFEDDD